MLLSRHDIVTCEIAGTVAEVNEKVNLGRFDLVLLDINLPDGRGVDLLELLRRYNNASKIIAMSGNMTSSLVSELMSHGVDGVYDKGDSSQELTRVLDQVLSDASEVMSTKVQLLNSNAEVYNLSRRQLEVLQYLVQGLTNKEISIQQGLSQATVAFHIAELRKKLNCKTSREILIVARQQGIVS
jgi:DNA-binding NarL/FixJ family response regulator